MIDFLQLDPRSAKKLDNLITSFDQISSHLLSTFTALSTALSRNTKHYPILSATGPIVDGKPQPQRRRKPAKVHILFVLGPTIMSAPAMRARVLLEIDGLEVRQFGERDDVPLQLAGVSENGTCSWFTIIQTIVTYLSPSRCFICATATRKRKRINTLPFKIKLSFIPEFRATVRNEQIEQPCTSV